MAERTLPTAGMSPIDVYNTQVRPNGYFEHVVTVDSTQRHNIELIATPTMISAGQYVNLYVKTTTAGTAATLVDGMFVTITQGNTKNVNGYFAAAELELNMGTGYTPSDHAVLMLDYNSTNVVLANCSNHAYIMLQDFSSGDKCQYLFNHLQGEIVTGGIFEVVTAGAATHGIKINWGGTDYWIMCVNSAS